MASPCYVHYCKNIGNHRFPKDQVRRTQWIQAIKYVKPGLTLRKHSLICSAHFRPTDFLITCCTADRPRKMLNKTAVPSIFAWTQQQDEIPQKLDIDPAKVEKTYSRTPPIQYIETFPFLDTQTEENVDPLLISDQEVECQQPDIVRSDVISIQAAYEETEQHNSKDLKIISVSELG